MTIFNYVFIVCMNPKVMVVLGTIFLNEHYKGSMNMNRRQIQQQCI